MILPPEQATAQFHSIFAEPIAKPSRPYQKHLARASIMILIRNHRRARIQRLTGSGRQCYAITRQFLIATALQLIQSGRSKP
jgi:hypothetical protein